MRKVCCFFLLVMAVSAFGLSIKPVLSEEIVLRETADSPETRYGAHLDTDGWVHFVVHAPEATAVNLLLFEKADARTPTLAIPLRHDGPDWKIKIKGQGIGTGLLLKENRGQIFTLDSYSCPAYLRRERCGWHMLAPSIM
jgi:hypothetical protein